MEQYFPCDFFVSSEGVNGLKLQIFILKRLLRVSCTKQEVKKVSAKFSKRFESTPIFYDKNHVLCLRVDFCVISRSASFPHRRPFPQLTENVPSFSFYYCCACNAMRMSGSDEPIPPFPNSSAGGGDPRYSYSAFNIDYDNLLKLLSFSHLDHGETIFVGSKRSLQNSDWIFWNFPHSNSSNSTSEPVPNFFCYFRLSHSYLFRKYKRKCTVEIK